MRTADSQRLADVTDRLEIMSLAAEYGHLVDSSTVRGLTVEDRERIADRLAQLFLPDGILDVVAGGRFGGAKEIRKIVLSDSVTPWEHLGAGLPTNIGRTVHTSSDHVFEVDGDTASVKSYAMVYRQMPKSDAMPNGLLMMTERYDDELTRTQDGWRFAVRRVTIVHANVPRESVADLIPRHFLE